MVKRKASFFEVMEMFLAGLVFDPYQASQDGACNLNPQLNGALQEIYSPAFLHEDYLIPRPDSQLLPNLPWEGDRVIRVDPSRG